VASGTKWIHFVPAAEGGGRGRGGPLEGRIQNTPAAKLVYIKLPMYLFFMALGLNNFEGGKSITRAIGRGAGPWKSRLFGPKKVSILRAYPFQWPGNGFFRIKIITSRAINNRYINR
jgi:hypothetical protein